MRSKAPLVKPIVWQSFLSATALIWTTSAHALVDFATPGKVTQSLPDLQGGGRPLPGYIGLARERAALAYSTRYEKWGAKLEHYMAPSPALTVDYGRVLSNTFGAGGTFTRQDEQSEIVFNGIFAPKKNVRIRLAGAQLRTDPGIDGGEGLEQNSYLLGARKFWNKYEYLSDVGITAYTVAANTAIILPLSDANPLDENLVDPFMSASGRLNGYMLNLNLRPTPDSRIELRHELSHMTHYVDTMAMREESSAMNRIRYSRYFSDCLQLHGGYSTGSETEQLELTLSRDKWNLRLSREQTDSSSAHTMLQIGYRIPLGRRGHARHSCGSPDYSPGFDPIVDAAVTPPPGLPREPLAIMATP